MLIMVVGMTDCEYPAFTEGVGGETVDPLSCKVRCLSSLVDVAHTDGDTEPRRGSHELGVPHFIVLDLTKRGRNFII